MKRLLLAGYWFGWKVRTWGVCRAPDRGRGSGGGEDGGAYFYLEV
jgi:hypothetical protein